VSTAPTTIAALASYRNETPYPFCPGCGHGPILDRLNEALVDLALDPRQVVLVSDIGCSGLSDQYFATSAFHGLHGRSITYASGIKLARPELTVIVIMGDGGTGIGGTHLLSAARRNIGISVLVFNNFNFGMTGGQHSTTTPAGAITATTPGGNLERPLDLCATVGANGAGFVYRGTSFDSDLAARIAEGIRHQGFSLLDIWEPCTAYYVPSNRLSRKALYQTLERLGFESGIVKRRDAPEYCAAYRDAARGEHGKPAIAPRPIAAQYGSTLARRYRLVVAGAAGARVGTAVGLAARAAIASGLWAAQRNDYPVTVRTGYSVSELIVSPDEIHYPGISKPDALLILSPEGRKVAARYLREMDARDRVFTLPELGDVDTRAPVAVIDPGLAPTRLKKTDVALAAVAGLAARLGLFPPEALDAAIRLGDADRAEERLRVAAAGRELIED
jgi:pyruvate/2-oxoacid:ferredoxin oxidoreductase beta subunit/Pyruvate/2-oxoacid:ferredoxin oxidoreductase gamma subunit